MPANAKFKLTIVKLIELSLEKNKDLSLRIIKNKGPFKLYINQSGDVTLESVTGVFVFQGTDVLKEVGLNVKFATVSFSAGEDKAINYTAAFKLGTGAFLGEVSFTSEIDMEVLILSCTGILCIAARALKRKNDILKNREYMRYIR